MSDVDGSELRFFARHVIIFVALCCDILYEQKRLRVRGVC